MYRIVLVAFLITVLSSQIFGASTSRLTSADLPSEQVTNRYLLSDDRQYLSLQLIDQIFSRRYYYCSIKIKFIECYMGKLRALMHEPSERSSGSNGRSQNGSGNGQEIKKELAQVEFQIEELRELQGTIRGIENDDISPEGKDKFRILARKYLLRFASRELQLQAFEAQKELDQNLQTLDEINSRQHENQQDLKVLRRRYNSNGGDRSAIFRRIRAREDEGKEIQYERMVLNRKFSEAARRTLYIVLGFKVLAEQEMARKNQKRTDLRNELKNMGEAPAKSNFNSKSSNAFIRVEEKEFSCIGIVPEEIDENRNEEVVVTLTPDDFEKFIQSTYNVSNVTQFDHDDKDEISLIRYAVDLNDVSPTSKVCCDEDQNIITGTIEQIDEQTFTIRTNGGRQISVDYSVCSRVYKINNGSGDRIILKTAVNKGSVYILDALIYSSS